MKRLSTIIGISFYKIVILLIGLIFVFWHQTIHVTSWKMQILLFAVGIIVLGIPHGAADLLVASRNSEHTNANFSQYKFLRIYLLRLILYAILLWLNPLVGLILFLILAAFHFGETDLYLLKLNTWLGKLVALFYGFTILSFLLLCNVAEIKPLLNAYSSSGFATDTLLMVTQNSVFIITMFIALFLTFGIAYFFKYGITKKQLLIVFAQSAILIVILYNLPLLTGFMFYFIVWHSTVSLKNIFSYLCKNTSLSPSIVVKQILLYSILALVGIAVFGFLGVMFSSAESIVIFLIAGLAVLTAPHMEVMHEMYVHLRK